jgi:quercetin dioxygenase-like cupin family protein
MSTLDRPLHGSALHFDLDREEREATHPETLERDGRSSRTLLKDGALRVTLIVLAPGGGIPEHHADGPVAIQPLRGRVTVSAEGETHRVGAGAMVALGPGVPHAVQSDDGAAFLLIVSHPAGA